MPASATTDVADFPQTLAKQAIGPSETEHQSSFRRRQLKQVEIDLLKGKIPKDEAEKEHRLILHKFEKIQEEVKEDLQHVAGRKK